MLYLLLRLRYKLDDGFASRMRRRYLISSAINTVDSLPCTHHLWIDNSTKTQLRSSPGLAKHPTTRTATPPPKHTPQPVAPSPDILIVSGYVGCSTLTTELTLRFFTASLWNLTLWKVDYGQGIMHRKRCKSLLLRSVQKSAQQYGKRQ